jgi:hypothetical protein
MEDLMVKIEADATTVDTNVLRCVREKAVSPTDVCFEVVEKRFEILV